MTKPNDEEITFLNKSPTLPIELLSYITEFAGFRELLILHFIVPEVCPKHYLRDYGSLSIEKAIDEGKVYEVTYRLWNKPINDFLKKMLISRAIRLSRWSIVKVLVTLFNTKPELYIILESIKRDIDPITLNILINTYQEPLRERIRPVCLYLSEYYNNADVFISMVKKCKEQKRRRGQINRILKLISERNPYFVSLNY